MTRWVSLFFGHFSKWSPNPNLQSITSQVLVDVGSWFWCLIRFCSWWSNYMRAFLSIIYHSLRNKDDISKMATQKFFFFLNETLQSTQNHDFGIYSHVFKVKESNKIITELNRLLFLAIFKMAANTKFIEVKYLMSKTT